MVLFYSNFIDDEYDIGELNVMIAENEYKLHGFAFKSILLMICYGISQVFSL